MKNIELLNEMILNKYVVCQKHPEADMYIYNYTSVTQYDNFWNEVTLSCRGLILDGEGRVIARPFPKFFNLGEYENQHIPNESFEVFEKMDGSLGISYSINGKIHIATRGSFTSEQSVKANQLLSTKYRDAVHRMDPTITYLFEIIYPENRIVVDYGSEEKLVLLAMINIATGKEIELEDIGFPVVKKLKGIKNVYDLEKSEEDNKEGFVIKYKNGYRLKVKFEEYVRLHRIINHVSTISIWEYLKTGQSLNEVLDQVPDEYYSWIRKKRLDLEKQFANIENQALCSMKAFATRKLAAAYIMTCNYPSVMFAMLDKKEYKPIIWKMIRPKFERPFTSN